MQRFHRLMPSDACKLDRRDGTKPALSDVDPDAGGGGIASVSDSGYGESLVAEPCVRTSMDDELPDGSGAAAVGAAVAPYMRGAGAGADVAPYGRGADVAGRGGGGAPKVATPRFRALTCGGRMGPDCEGCAVVLPCVAGGGTLG